MSTNLRCHNRFTASIILLTLLLLLPTARGQLTQHGIFEGMINFFTEGSHRRSLVPVDIADTSAMLPAYDFIVVGAGTAGCVLANRLSENSNHSVLLIEAGRDENFVMDVPVFANLLQLTDTNWGHRTERQDTACLGLKNGQCKYPRGKVFGGSSVLNYMVFTRGNRKDYDKWAELGNVGWSYEDVHKYFLRMEDIAIPELYDSPDHAKGGPVTISYPPWHTKIAESFLEAASQMGSPILDYDGPQQTGFQYLHATLKNGTRWSSNSAYLIPAMKRRNLHVIKMATVSKVLIDDRSKRAYGVQYIRRGRKFEIRAKKEVILSAGALGSPHILMLSGIGPEDHLKSMRIPVIQDLKVGYNLQDHVALGGLTFVVDDQVSLQYERVLDDEHYLVDFLKYHQGPFSVPGGVEALGFIHTKYSNASEDYPDIELLLSAGSFGSNPSLRESYGMSNDIYQRMFRQLENRDSFMIFPILMHPHSKGRVMLRNTNPLKLPLIRHNYFTEGDDLDVLVEGVKEAIKLTKAPAFRKYRTRIHDIPVPACVEIKFNTDDYWRCAIRQMTFTYYHQSGTCKMGPNSDLDAVVDPELRVRGVSGLRVADASIMPFVITGHTNGPTFMIGEKASDMIKQTWRT